MSRAHRTISILLIGLLPALASCNDKSGSLRPAQGLCKADAARELLGKPRPTNAEAMRLTNSKLVRQIEPGQMVTHDYRQERVTIETDPASGRVVGATCG
ncbi:I78 family peptidase inhibitor [Phyllobacterium ifriqiyense]|uniref:I78 family peptidase inhibitor n=1 Tax=Phyllobacterium ifriqiyense TaxID=314238 RepID=UPI00339484CA